MANLEGTVMDFKGENGLVTLLLCDNTFEDLKIQGSVFPSPVTWECI